MLIFIFVISLIIFSIIFNKTKIDSNNDILIKKEIISISSNKKSLDNSYLVPELEPVSDEINELNLQLPKFLDVLNFDSVINEVDRLSAKARENSADVIDQIREYVSDVKSYQIQLRKLQRICGKNNEYLQVLEKIIADNHQNLQEMQFNQYYFELGLKESGFCERVGTSKDVFWLFLNIARQGDQLAQFLLLDNLLEMVMSKERFNIRKQPLEYMHLRDEAIDYLVILAKKGMHRASDLLGKIYSSKNNSYYNIVENNYLLAYYYFTLANKQSDSEPISYRVNPEVIYEKLTDKQKTIADRMTKNL